MAYKEEMKEVVRYYNLSKPLKTIVVLSWIFVALLTISIILNLFG